MPNILEAQRLDLSSLRALISREVFAIRVCGFCNHGLACALAEWFSSHEARRNFEFLHATAGLQASDTDRVGTPFNKLFHVVVGRSVPHTQKTEEIVSGYQSESLEQFRAVREFCSPQLSPIDNLRLLLDEQWPSGAQIARLKNVRAYAGIARIMEGQCGPSADTDPHVDWLPAIVRQFDAQLSAIVYLRLPDEGGELELWDVTTNYVVKYTREDGTLDRGALPAPIVVKPAVGDLILINTRYPHAVRNFQSGTRAVQTCFIGVSAEKPLQLWS